MNLKPLMTLGLSVLCLAPLSLLRADTITVYQNSAGATPTVNLTATFSSLSQGTSLNSYTEDGIQFVMSGGTDYNSYSPAPAGFSGGFFYGSTNSPAVISLASGGTMYGIQFYVGSGWGQVSPGSILPLAWGVFRGGSQVGSGTFSATQTASGYLLGFADDAGFTSLQIVNCSSTPCTLSSGNAIAIDNVSIDTAASAPVPEPASVMLLGTVLLAGGAGIRRRFFPRA